MKVMQKYEIIDVPEIEKPGIYAIHNKANDKYYIGSAKKPISPPKSALVRNKMLSRN